MYSNRRMAWEVMILPSREDNFLYKLAWICMIPSRIYRNVWFFFWRIGGRGIQKCEQATFTLAIMYCNIFGASPWGDSGNTRTKPRSLESRDCKAISITVHNIRVKFININQIKTNVEYRRPAIHLSLATQTKRG